MFYGKLRVMRVGTSHSGFTRLFSIIEGFYEGMLFQLSYAFSYHVIFATPCKSILNSVFPRSRLDFFLDRAFEFFMSSSLEVLLEAVSSSDILSRSRTRKSTSSHSHTRTRTPARARARALTRARQHAHAHAHSHALRDSESSKSRDINWV